MKTRALIADVSALEDDEVFNKHYDLASDYRKKKLESIKLRAVKNQSLGVDVLLRIMLTDIGLWKKDIRICEKEYGKPYLAEYKDLYFNFSHSNQKVMCVLSDHEIGCDVEKVSEKMIDYAIRALPDEEHKWLNSIAEEEKRQSFYRLWTLKESFIKQKGLGFYLDIKSFYFEFDKENEPILHQNIDENQYYFSEYDLSDGYKYSVCSLSSDPVQFEQIEFI